MELAVGKGNHHIGPVGPVYFTVNIRGISHFIEEGWVVEYAIPDRLGVMRLAYRTPTGRLDASQLTDLLAHIEMMCEGAITQLSGVQQELPLG